jgi:Kef-type K+ transport system membrane component KefB
MTAIWAQISFVFFLAILASIVSRTYRISTALSEIIVGMLARLTFAYILGVELLSVQEPWIKTLAGIGAIFLTFLAGAELDPDVFKLKWKEAAAVGLSSFLLPSFCCWGAAHFLLGWENSSSLLEYPFAGMSGLNGSKNLSSSK